MTNGSQCFCAEVSARVPALLDMSACGKALSKVSMSSRHASGMRVESCCTQAVCSKSRVFQAVVAVSDPDSRKSLMCVWTSQRLTAQALASAKGLESCYVPWLQGEQTQAVSSKSKEAEGIAAVPDPPPPEEEPAGGEPEGEEGEEGGEPKGDAEAEQKLPVPAKDPDAFPLKDGIIIDLAALPPVSCTCCM